MKKNNIYFIYFLTVYVIIQYIWWTYFILNIDQSPFNSKAKNWMIIGEGSVFLFIIIFAFSRLIVSLKKESRLNEQKNNFLMSITHELKTPIAHNKLTLQTLLKRKNIEETARIDLTEKVLAENTRLEHLVENILTATRLETNYFKLNKEKFDFYILVNELIKRYSILLGDAQINVIRNTEKTIVNADQSMIETVIINIIENYHKYALDSKEFNIILSTFGDRVKCSFTDMGEGVPAEFQRDIFKKFVRAENEEVRTKKGTGLGLYISKEFLKLNQGTISFTPNKPKGAVFEITLPLA
ncbi:MAG: hypothetical protein J0G96_01510 [Flavobacteriia bacterium]|nr:hypothetical protein [Flavobacteriia bacterium]OJX38583.1 MAG: hypothetical protein BGO87_10765 [Flavobacteriia bacterium 40-80]